MSDARRLPLDGITVLSLAINLPGPLAAARLLAFGAAVTKVEPPAGDPLSVAAPAWYAELVAGQRVRTLDLKAPLDREELEDELAGADLLLTAMRPSALDRLGIGASVRRLRIAHVEIVGYDGPTADRPGHDLTYQAAHGTLVPPEMPVVPVADLLGAERAVSAALAALRCRDRGDADSTVRVVLDDAARAAAEPLRHRLTGRGAPLGGALPGYAVYACADGYVAVAALEPGFAARLAEQLGGTHVELATAFARQSGEYWQQWAADHDLPVVAVNRGPDPRGERR